MTPRRQSRATAQGHEWRRQQDTKHAGDAKFAKPSRPPSRAAENRATEHRGTRTTRLDLVGAGVRLARRRRAAFVASRRIRSADPTGGRAAAERDSLGTRKTVAPSVSSPVARWSPRHPQVRARRTTIMAVTLVPGAGSSAVMGRFDASFTTRTSMRISNLATVSWDGSGLQDRDPAVSVPSIAM